MDLLNNNLLMSRLLMFWLGLCLYDEVCWLLLFWRCWLSTGSNLFWRIYRCSFSFLLSWLLLQISLWSRLLSLDLIKQPNNHILLLFDNKLSADIDQIQSNPLRGIQGLINLIHLMKQSSLSLLQLTLLNNLPGRR